MIKELNLLQLLTLSTKYAMAKECLQPNYKIKIKINLNIATM
jgi:hypothetical protein